MEQKGGLTGQWVEHGVTVLKVIDSRQERSSSWSQQESLLGPD